MTLTSISTLDDALDRQGTDDTVIDLEEITQVAEPDQALEQILPFNEFIDQFGSKLLDAVNAQNPAV